MLQSLWIGVLAAVILLMPGFMIVAALEAIERVRGRINERRLWLPEEPIYCEHDTAEEDAARRVAAKNAKEALAKEKDRATAEAKAVFEAKLNSVAQAVNGALRQIGIQIEDIGMSLDEMNKTDKDGAQALANKAKVALQAMVDAIEW